MVLLVNKKRCYFRIGYTPDNKSASSTKIFNLCVSQNILIWSLSGKRKHKKKKIKKPKKKKKKKKKNCLT